MKIAFVCFLLLFSFSLFSQSKKVSVKIVQVLPYCGGAKPNKDLQDKPNNSVAYANKKLILVSDKQKTDTIKTDKNGCLTLKLPIGIYLAFEPWKYYNKVPKGMQESNMNMDCLKDEWKKEDLKIAISKKTTTVIDNLKLPKCSYQFPCLINKHLPQ